MVKKCLYIRTKKEPVIDYVRNSVEHIIPYKVQNQCTELGGHVLLRHLGKKGKINYA